MSDKSNNNNRQNKDLLNKLLNKLSTRSYTILSFNVRQKDFKTLILFEELVYRERTKRSNLIVQAMKEYVQRHHPGNPQLPLSKFGVATKSTKKCDYPRCNELAEYLAFPHPPASNLNVCGEHFKEAMRKRLLKRWKKI